MQIDRGIKTTFKTAEKTLDNFEISSKYAGLIVFFVITATSSKYLLKNILKFQNTITLWHLFPCSVF